MNRFKQIALCTALAAFPAVCSATTQPQLRTQTELLHERQPLSLTSVHQAPSLTQQATVICAFGGLFCYSGGHVYMLQYDAQGAYYQQIVQSEAPRFPTKQFPRQTPKLN